MLMQFCLVDLLTTIVFTYIGLMVQASIRSVLLLLLLLLILLMLFCLLISHGAGVVKITLRQVNHGF